MSPYTFLPGLGSTTTIHLPPTSLFPQTNAPSVLLTFTALPISQAAENGSRVEVWTEAGTSGEWRAIPFTSPTAAGHSESTSHTNEPSILVAQICLPVKETSFGYTYRIQHDSGDITWLGDMGCNGRVELVRSSGTQEREGEGGGEGEAKAEEELWKADEWLDFTMDKWTGFGVHVDDRDIPHGVFLSETSQDLTFAYIHPSSHASTAAGGGPPFATFHPTTPATSISSTAIALLPASPSSSSEIYLSTCTTSLKPIIRGEGTTGVQPAAYASYCGVGFAGGEGDRSKAFQSLFTRHRHRQQQQERSSASRTWEYLPRIVRDETEQEPGHAVALVCPHPGGTGIAPTSIVAYFAPVQEGTHTRDGLVQWDCSAILPVDREGKVAFWSADERCAIVPVVKEGEGEGDAQGKLVVSFCTSQAPLLKTLQVVHLLELKHAGSSVVFGVLAVSGDGTTEEDASGWEYEPEKVQVEEYYVEEQVIAPSRTSTSTPKAIPDIVKQGNDETTTTTMSDEPGSADSGVTESTTSPGSSERGDETSVTSIEEVLDDVPTASSSKPQQGNAQEEREYVFVAPVSEEEQTPMTGDLHAAETGNQASDLAEGDATRAMTSGSNDNDTREQDTASPATSSEPTAVAPRKSFFRFLWITLGLFQSLYFRAVSWFRRWWAGSSVGTVAGGNGTDTDTGPGEGAPANSDHDHEETPLLNKDSAADYASTSERTLPGGYSQSMTPQAPQEVQEPALEQAEEVQEPVPQAMETIQVLEKRKTVLPAYIHTRKAVAGDLFLLTSLREVDGIVAEIQHEHTDDDGTTSDPSWTTVHVAREAVAPESQLRMVKVSGIESNSHLRIRLV